MAFYILVLAVIGSVYAESDSSQVQSAEARQLPYSPQYPVDLQYDFTLLDPQFQYPQFSGNPSRVQPQVFVYPSGAAGQPFLLQPGAPPGNFLIPQPQPGFVLRDAPMRPPVFVSGYPKPAYVPPTNKDAEEIPIHPGNLQPIAPSPGRKPEKLETFDEKPEPERPSAGEADVLASADRTLGTNPSLRPGHRFFILNGQPLFSNYPLPQFADSPYQPPMNKFEPENTNFYTYRQNGPSFLPDGFNRSPLENIPTYKVPVGNFFVRNSVTGQINDVKQQDFEKQQNEIVPSQNFVSLNQLDEAVPDILFKNLPSLTYKKQNLENVQTVKTYPNENNFQIRSQQPVPKLQPIEVADNADFTTNNDRSADSRKTKEPTTTAKGIPAPLPVSPEISQQDKVEQPSISRSQPTALALAGPGGVAAAAPRATALTGDKGVSVSSPQATAIAGPSRNQIKKKPVNVKEAE